MQQRCCYATALLFARFRACGARADGRIIAASEIFAKRGYRMEYRLEHDTMGEVRVPADHYWGAQTQRSFENFRIGTEKIPPEVIRAFAVVKSPGPTTTMIGLPTSRLR